ncbi:MAG: type II toxin-antitoxin system VapC family toxin [Planctomycetes bacterium]|nr:type II toxin-antitoxin system VapC family toxin [Planctomycetota bacterium]
MTQPPPDRYVIDASVGIKLVIEEPGSEDAHALLAHVADDPNGRIYIAERWPCSLFRYLIGPCIGISWHRIEVVRSIHARVSIEGKHLP